MEELERGGIGGAINGSERSLAKRTRSETISTTPEHKTDTVRDVSTQVRTFVDDGRSKLVSKIEGIARAVRSTEESMRDGDDDLSRYAGLVGDKLEAAARYVRTHEPRDVASTIETLAKREPVMFLGGVFVAGLALGRFLRSSDARRNEPEPEVSSDAPSRDADGEHYAVAGTNDWAARDDAPRDAAPSAFGTLPTLNDDDGNVTR